MPVKIGTINIDWFKKSKATQMLIKEAIIKQDFDFLIVTENVMPFNFDDAYFVYHSQQIPIDTKFQKLDYKAYLKGEIPVRLSIFSKYSSINKVNVNDAYTSICHQFNVNDKQFTIYGTIIGTWGIKYQNEFAKNELENFENDIETILKTNKNLIVAGDLNTSFIATEKRELSQIKSREAISNFTNKHNINRVTQNLSHCIDHIFITENLLNIETSTWLDKDELKDKDHFGVKLIIV